MLARSTYTVFCQAPCSYFVKQHEGKHGKTMSLKKMQVLEDELFLSDRAHGMMP
jgi:hypothetical protein